MGMPSANGFEEEQPRRWAIRISNRTDSEITAARQHFERTAGERIAEEWQAGLRQEIAKLSQFPARLPVAPEDKLFQETVRVFLYRRTPRGPAYRIFFILKEAGQEAPTVGIIHARHAAQKPMTRKEAREIEASK